jgi:DNA (cytosine-5)-methyltransferase 1
MTASTKTLTVGSICSGIEAASVAWAELPFKLCWLSEISKFPASLLAKKYPHIANLGDMCEIPDLIVAGKTTAPDLLCGGTPCQAFSLAGWKRGLSDTRGNLTLKFVDIINANDAVRELDGKPKTIVFWENVEGVLRDKTNAFGCLISSLAGYDEEIKPDGKWPQSGLLRGPQRSVAWRVIDAKYFGVPQQRRRLYVLAGGSGFNPEDILFEVGTSVDESPIYGDAPTFSKSSHTLETFRAYTDCLYSAYGTKWNGNAAAYNGSLFFVQNQRLRRLTPLECERLMGFPDRYTDIPGATHTTRYQALGNSWAVPVVRWIGERIVAYREKKLPVVLVTAQIPRSRKYSDEVHLWDFGKKTIELDRQAYLAGGASPLCPKPGRLEDVVDTDAPEKLYITPAGCKGILRRKAERGLRINPKLELVLQRISATWSDEKIESISRVQSRGRFSTALPTIPEKAATQNNLQLWDD